MKQLHLFVLPLLLGSGLAAQEQTDWTNWRGPNFDGTAAGDPPSEWDEASGKNIKWKVEIPGRGSSSPIVLGDRIYVTTAIPLDENGKEARPPESAGGFGGGGQRGGGQRGGGRGFGRSGPAKKHQFAVIAYDRKTGEQIWTADCRTAVPHAGHHGTATYASNSPITDGKHIYASFGSNGIYCVTLDGKIKWSKDLGDMRTRNSFGEGSSPALHGDSLVINWDHEDDSFICALDKNSGETLWKKPRDEATTWTTPLIIEIDGKALAVVAASNRVRAYDLRNGKVAWYANGMTRNVIPTPIYANGLVYVMSGYGGSALLAIDPKGARRRIRDKNIAWKHSRNTPYTPSAVLYDGNLYFTRVNSAILSCLDAKTGEIHYEGKRLRGVRTMYSSPVAAAGRVYLTGRQGTTKVVKAGDNFEEVATNKLDDTVDSTFAIVGDAIFVRGWKHLYCLAESKGAK